MRNLSRLALPGLQAQLATAGAFSAHVSPPGETVRTLPVYLTADEIHRLIASAVTDRDRLLLWFLWVTGGRISEVLQARWGDLTESGIRLPNLKQTRHGLGEKHVLLPPEVLAGLREKAQDHAPGEYIFSRRPGGRPISRVTAWRIVTQAAAAAGLYRRRRPREARRPVWPHVLRHSYAVHLLRQGLPITLVQRQLGHRSLLATQVYTQIADLHAEALMKEVRL